MSTSLILTLLFVLFVATAIIMPYNRMLMIFKATIVPSLLYIVLFLVDKIFTDAHLYYQIGLMFDPVWEWLLTGFSEISTADYYNLSAILTLTIFYFILFAISFIIVVNTFLGSNPSLSKRKTLIKKIFLAIGFIGFDFAAMMIFISESRELFPIADGYLKPILNLIYNYGALK